MKESKTIRSLHDWAALYTRRYRLGEIVADVKFEPNSENGWMVAGNDWVNASRGLVWPITREELIAKGWIPE